MNKTGLNVVALMALFLGLAAAAPAQGPALANLMREKLAHAQKILEGVVTSDWTAVENHTRDLQRITNDPRWTVLRYPEYARYSGAFVKALEDLHRAAAQRDLEKTPEAYAAMALKCVECHRYLARTRLAK